MNPISPIVRLAPVPIPAGGTGSHSTSKGIDATRQVITPSPIHPGDDDAARVGDEDLLIANTVWRAHAANGHRKGKFMTFAFVRRLLGSKPRCRPAASKCYRTSLTVEGLEQRCTPTV